MKRAAPAPHAAPPVRAMGAATSHSRSAVARSSRLHRAIQASGSSAWGRSCHPVPAGTAPTGAALPIHQPGDTFCTARAGWEVQPCSRRSPWLLTPLFQGLVWFVFEDGG